MKDELYEAKQDLLEAKENYRRAYERWKHLNEGEIPGFSKYDMMSWATALESGSGVWVPNICLGEFKTFCKNKGLKVFDSKPIMKEFNLVFGNSIEKFQA